MKKVYGKGTVKGVAYVTEIYKGENTDADILIAYYVDPEALHTLARFKAVIVVFGGILSHAAIFCREMEIPCIVSADKEVLNIKNGSVVEVNFERPYIKVLTI